MMKELPKGWIYQDLVEITTKIGSGSTPRGGQDVYKTEGIPLIRSMNVRFTGLDAKGLAFIDDEQANKLNAVTINDKDVLLNITGASIGRVSVARDWAVGGRVNQHVCIIRPVLTEPLSAYLNYYLMTPIMQDYINSNESGATRQALTKAKIEALTIPLAPLAEQKRIVEKLDEVLAQVDTIKARLDGIPAILKRFRQSVIAAAVSGKLTEEWRGNFSLPESVLERYIKFRDNVIAGVSSATQKEKLIKTHQKDENFEFPLAIPNTWLLKNLNKIAFGFSYGSSFKSQTVGIVPVLRMGNIQNGKLDWNDLVYTSDSTEIEKYRLSKGDILFNRTNSPELVGKTAIYQGEKEAIYAGYLIKVQGSELLYSEFLNIALNSLHAKNYCLSVKTDGVSQSNINAQKLGDFPCPLPSIEEQAEIVRLVDQYFTFADSIEAQVKKAQARVDNLTQSILAKAFRGELVPQDPNDEPADKLLERIAQARLDAEALAKAVKEITGSKKKATKTAKA